jgi:hypothetical protein
MSWARSAHWRGMRNSVASRGSTSVIHVDDTDEYPGGGLTTSLTGCSNKGGRQVLP